jgi:hypothetical protein
MKLRLPLLVSVVATLAVAGLLPLGLSFYQLRSNEDALFSQVRVTHIVAASTAARRVDAALSSLFTVADSFVTHPVMLADPRSPASQELLRGILQARPDIVALGVFSNGGEVILAQRVNLREHLGDVAAGGSVEMLTALGQRWLRLRRPFGSEGYLVLVADAKPLESMVAVSEIGEEAEMLLISRDGAVVAGKVELASLPEAAVERAKTAKLDAEAARYEDAQVGAMIVGYAQVRQAPWVVLSRQPAWVAEVAEVRMRRASRLAALAALALTALFSGLAWWNVIRPLRRLARKQQELLGKELEGSEIEQLEASFRVLEERIAQTGEIGEVSLGRYRVEGLLGSGAMGSVFRGWDPKLQRAVALKTIRLNAEDLDREKLVKSLLSEATLSARFNHSNIVTVYDMAQAENNAFIAMELVQGVSLDAYLWDRETLTPEEVILLGAAIARALAVAHGHGLVHHDVKPANVLLGDDGSIKVTDFGISELISSAVKVGDVICGTPGYLAPEALMGEGYTPKSDLFALGLILYESLVGTHPFFGRNIKETMLNTIMGEAEPIDRLKPSVPLELARLIHQLLAKEPKERPASAEAVARTLEEMAMRGGLRWQVRRETLRSLSSDGFENRTRTQIISLPERHAIRPEHAPPRD